MRKLRVVLVSPLSPTFMVPYVKQFAIAQNSLAAVEECTPDFAEIVGIIDENLLPAKNDSILANRDLILSADLVGITANTATAIRAYQISEIIKAWGKKVVLGGIHPTFFPDEALQYCDAVVVGEAENVWPTLLKDLSLDKLKKSYDGVNDRPETWKIPKSAKISKFAMPLHISRGCPFSCDFCCVPHMFGRRQRKIPIEDLVNALKNKKPKWPGIVPLFDDNLLVNHQEGIELCHNLGRLGIKWGAMTSIDVADDEKLLASLKSSGCKILLIGFESLNKENLVSTHKRNNLAKDYREAIRKIHSYGISVCGSFIVGFDYDTQESISLMGDELIGYGIDMATFSILTPFPGTSLFNSLVNEDRILHFNWELYTGGHAIIKPVKRNVSPQDIEKSFLELRQKFFSIRSILSRFLSSPNKSVMLALNLAAHYSFRNALKGNHPNVACCRDGIKAKYIPSLEFVTSELKTSAYCCIGDTNE